MNDKQAALPPQVTHTLVGAPIGATIGAGIQYARNYDNPDEDARWRAVGKGAFGGSVLGALGGALHGQTQVEEATRSRNEAAVAARDFAARLLERRQQALDGIGARPNADYRGGQLEINTNGDYNVGDVRGMSDGAFESFLRQMADKISPMDVQLRERARLRNLANKTASLADQQLARALGFGKCAAPVVAPGLLKKLDAAYKSQKPAPNTPPTKR